MSLSINELTTYRWSFEKDVTHYRAAGIGAIGVWRQKLSDFGEDRAIELLADSGLEVSNLLWAGGFTGSDGRSHEDSLADAQEAVRLAGALKARALVVYSGARNGHTSNHARRMFSDALEELLPMADDHDVILAVEPMLGDCAADWTLLTSLPETLALVEEIDHPRLKLVLDTYHVGHEPNLLDTIRSLVPRIAIVHLADALEPPGCEQNRCQLGAGTLPLREIIAALVDGGYEGYYDVELLGENLARCDYDELLRSSKDAFEQLTAGLSLSAK